MTMATEETKTTPEVVVDELNDDLEEEGDEENDHEERENGLPKDKNNSRFLRSAYFGLLHVFCLSLYLLPILTPSEYNNGTPVLDELHIMSSDNHDINGESSIRTIFQNDYWGRPLNSPSSHKSWRPLTVFSFRYLKGGTLLKDLTCHRLLNVITHACVAELVGILAVQLVPSHADPLLLRVLAKLLWVLHPTHVEVTANAANRPHLLAVLCSVVLSDPNLPLSSVYLLTLLTGFLSSETFLFQIVPATVTLSAIVYLQLYHGPHQIRQRGSLWKQVATILATVLPRLLLSLLGAVAYYGGRYYFDTLSIPDGLIRPAENPFYSLKGWDRVRNYAYILSIHIAKAWDLDFVGFSHEYRHECIRKIESWRDARLIIPMGIATGYLTVLLFLLLKQRRRTVLSIGLVLYLVHLSWMVTLFPISGIVKVGTFIADRIVVASTVSTCILVANAASSWVLVYPKYKQQRRQKLFVLGLLGALMWRRIYQRSVEWMDSYPLLESSLRTCPRFAKGHLELSKVYSGLYPSRFNLTQSRYHLEQVEAIDPDYCDVHQQFALVAIQEHGYTEFEERVTKALLCQYTISGSTELWKGYWNMALDSSQNPPDVVQAAEKRYNKYMSILGEAIAAEAERNEERQHKSSSPFVGWDQEL